MKIAIFSLILAIMIGSFSLWQYDASQKWMTKTETDLEHFHSDTASQISKLQAKQQILEQQERNIEKHQAPDFWELKQAEFLIRMASERLLIAQDVKGAVELLDAAEASLQSLNDPKLANLRAAIQQDRDALKAIQVPDRSGMWAKVSTLIQQLPQLPIRGLRGNKINNVTPNDEQHATEQKTETDNHGNAWQRSLQKFSDLIKIRRHTKPIEPILPLEDQFLARAHLHLLLEQIRLSIVEINPELYQQSLAAAQTWLSDYFEGNDPQVVNFQKQLQDLQQIQIKPAVPNLQHTLQSFQTLRT